MLSDPSALPPEVVLLNAHDGTSSYRIMSGVFRSICTNSMIVTEDGATDLRIPHKGDVFGQVIEGSFAVIEQSRLTLDRADAWAGVTLDQAEAQVMAEAAHIVRFGDARNPDQAGAAPGSAPPR